MRPLMAVLFAASVVASAAAGLVDTPAARPLDDEFLETLRAGAPIACAMNYTPIGDDTGCNACIYHGTITFYYPDGMGGWFPVEIDAWKRCQSQEPDDFCITGETYQSWCDKTTSACAATQSWVYQDDVCSNQIDGSTSCDESYQSATSTADPGLTCTGVEFGMY